MKFIPRFHTYLIISVSGSEVAVLCVQENLIISRFKIEGLQNINLSNININTKNSYILIENSSCDKDKNTKDYVVKIKMLKIYEENGALMNEYDFERRMK